VTKRLALWAPVVGYMALVFYASSLSELPALATRMSDKLEHGLAYSGLGVLLLRALAGGLWRPVSARAALLAVALAACYGASDELHQHFVPHRSMDANDLLADTAGAAVAIGALYAWGIIRARNGP
jgi:VanZ family protein